MQRIDTRREHLETPRATQLKRTRNVSRKRKTFFLILLIVVVVVGLSYASKIKQITIDTIEISGNSVLTNDEIKSEVEKTLDGNYFYIFSKRNALLYSKKQILKNLLTTYQRIENAEVLLKDLHTLSVRITERDGEYLWCGQKFSETNGEDASDGCYFIDTAGFIFSKSPNFSGPIYLKFFGGNFDSDSSDPIGRQFLDFFSFSQYIELIDSLKKLGIRPYALYIDENGDTNIYIAPITGGKKFYTKLVFSSKDTFEKSLQNLDAALQTEPLKTDFVKKFSTLLYIDLRFNNKVFYKFE